jgi:hypothetical protein
LIGRDCFVAQGAPRNDSANLIETCSTLAFRRWLLSLLNAAEKQPERGRSPGNSRVFGMMAAHKQPRTAIKTARNSGNNSELPPIVVGLISKHEF